jgi:hypothetical protein
MHPLPQLCTADLGSCGVLHQVKQGNAPDAAQPCFEIAQANSHILLQPGFGDLSLRNLQQIIGGGVVVGQLLRNLVGLGHEPIEYLQCHRNKPGMCNPRPIVPVTGLAFLVRLHLGDGFVVGHWV